MTLTEVINTLSNRYTHYGVYHINSDMACLFSRKEDLCNFLSPYTQIPPEEENNFTMNKVGRGYEVYFNKNKAFNVVCLRKKEYDECRKLMIENCETLESQEKFKAVYVLIKCVE